MKLADFKLLTLEDRLDWLFEHSVKDPAQRFDDEKEKWLNGEFKPDQRLLELEQRLENYYSDTKGSNTSEMLIHWGRFKDWSREVGYAIEEINFAKRRVTVRLGL